MTVTVDLEGFAMGEGTDYHINESGIRGIFGTPGIRTNDVSKGHADGTVVGYDYYDARLITIPVTVVGSTASACIAKLETLRDEWALATDLALLTLEINLWGDTYAWEGRPRAVTEDSLDKLASGIAEVTCEFYVPDPTVVDPS